MSSLVVARLAIQHAPCQPQVSSKQHGVAFNMHSLLLRAELHDEPDIRDTNAACVILFGVIVVYEQPRHTDPQWMLASCTTERMGKLRHRATYPGPCTSLDTRIFAASQPSSRSAAAAVCCLAVAPRRPRASPSLDGGGYWR